MGCLKNIISLIILILAIIGFYAVGGPDFVMNGINGIMNPSQQKSLEKAQTTAAFDDLSNPYKRQRVIDMFGIKAVFTEHEKTKQKIIIADAENAINLTQEDVKSNKVEQKIQQALDKFSFMSVKVGKFEVIGKSNIQVLGRTVPYVKIKANLAGLPYKNAEGILGVISQ